MSPNRCLRFLGLGNLHRSVRERLGARARSSRGRFPLYVEWLEDRTVLCGNGSLETALAVGPTGVTVEDAHAGESVGYFKVILPESGRLTILTQVLPHLPDAHGDKHAEDHQEDHQGGLNTRTSLLGPLGELLIESDGQSAANSDDLIVQHLLAGTYFVKIEGQGGGAGHYTLSTEFQPASPPGEPLQVPFDRDYPYGFTPTFHVAADFNADGRLDLATANAYTNDLSVLLGLGDGSFQAARNYPVGAIPFGIATADFNRDGILDLAAANQYSDDLSVLFGRGDGTFAVEVRFPAGLHPWGLTAGDLNADGVADLITADLRGNSVSVLLANGDGTFQTTRQFSTEEGANGLITADFDGDGLLDVAAANYNSNSISILLGNGDGTLQDQSVVHPGANPSDLAAADIDGDGWLDLVSANAGSGDVTVFWGPWNGSAFAGQTTLASGLSPYDVAAADFDGDGGVDLVVANRQSHDVKVLRNRGARSFADAGRYPVGIQPWSVAFGDFNGDGRLDLSTTNSYSHNVSILLGRGDGTFQHDSRGIRQGQTNPQGMAARDFNEDGILDLAVVTYSGGDLYVFLGRGDGTYQERTRFLVGSTPVVVVAEDFNHDGHWDLATINCDSGDFSVLLGRGDGTFADQERYPSSASGELVVTGDFNGDGEIDIVASGQFGSGIVISFGRGDGTFGGRHVFAHDEGPGGGAAGDFNEDGFLDLATTNFFALESTVSIHLGHGDGTFAEPVHVAVGRSPLAIVAGDFNEDGHVDLMDTNFGDRSMSLLLGRGDGTFLPEVRFATGNLPDSLRAVDLNGDGHLDVIVSNATADNVSVFLGHGDGTFADQELFRVGDGPTPRRGFDVADLNGDGWLDLAIPQVLPNDVSVLLGSGDGRFGEPLRFPVGLGPVALVADDFNGDGRLDVASVNPSTNKLAVSLGHGDTTLQPARLFDAGLAPVAILQGDFNRDGRPDLVTANQGSDDVSLFLGLGTGDFREQLRFTAGTNPVALASGDFNGDGRLDLAVASVAGTKNVAVLLGDRNRMFQDPQFYTAGDSPQALVAGDFNGDGRLDLAVANYRSQDATLLLGRGDGTFAAAPISWKVGSGPVALLTGDFNADGLLDLATANYRSNDVSVLLGKGGGQFHGAVSFAAGTNPLSLTAHDFNVDGRVDLAVSNSLSDDVTLLLGRGDGSFAEPVRVRAAEYPAGLVSGDFNDDGRGDLALAAQLATEIAIFPGKGDGTFLPPGTLSTPVRAIPLVVDWNRDGAADVLVVERGGDILLRLGRPGAAGAFEAPVVVNQNAPAARDLALVRTPGGTVLAVLDAFNSALSLYTPGADAALSRTAGPIVPGDLAVRLVAGDLNGDGRDDLVVVASGSAEVFVYLQSATGARLTPGQLFGSTPDYVLPVGLLPSDAALADVDGDRRLDIVVTNESSGDVSVLRNNLDDPFAVESRYRTGAGLYYLESDGEALVVRSGEKPARILAGNFDADSVAELIVTNSGSNTVSLLDVTASGSMLNPRLFNAGLKPAVAVTGRLNGDSFLDLAVLNEGTGDLSVFLGDGAGGFVAPAGSTSRLNAGNLPTGLAVHDVTGDGILDLLVGNEFGDILILPGNGDGAFQPYQRLGRGIALAVADLNGDGRNDFIFGNEALDRVTVQYSLPGQTFTQERGDGVLAPSAVSTADLNRDGRLDLIVANSGANNVLVYLGADRGMFAGARSFFAGTNPSGLTVQDLDGDGRLDLVVANEGSNDVSVLLGQGEGDGWTFTPGPRLRAGAAPASTTVVDATGDGIHDLIVSNSKSNDVFLLPGVGGGFFNDRTPLIFNTDNAPLQAFVGNFDARPGLDMVSVNAGSNNLTFFSGFLSASAVRVSLPSGGVNPVAAVTGDFNRDGLADLAVAHQGNGVIALLLGREDGLLLGGSQSLGADVHPTGLALAEAASGEAAFYVAREDAETALRLSFAFEFGPVSLPASVSQQFGESSRAQFAEVLPLENATIAVVATLLTVRGDPDALAGQFADREASDFAADLLAFTDLLAHESDQTPDNGEESPEADGSADGSPERLALLGFLTGNDEAMARPRDLTREALLYPPAERAAQAAQLAALRQLLAAWLREGGNHPDDAPQALLDVARSAAAWLAERLGPGQPPGEPRVAPPPVQDKAAPPRELQEMRRQDDASVETSANAAALVTTIFALGYLHADRRPSGNEATSTVGRPSRRR
jgi:large repetitive protein